MGNRRSDEERKREIPRAKTYWHGQEQEGSQPLDTGSQDETGLIFITTGDLW